jgi:hypothetical protein
MSVPEQAPRLTDVPGRLEDRAGVLGLALATWATRDDSKAQPGVRQAANDAMDAIDAMLAELHRARTALMDDMRDSDDATTARAMALLARLRADRENPSDIAEGGEVR